LTTKLKAYAFEVPVDIGGRRSGVLADHLKSVDWRARQAERLARVPTHIVDRVAAIVAALIGA